MCLFHLSLKHMFTSSYKTNEKGMNSSLALKLLKLQKNKLVTVYRGTA